MVFDYETDFEMVIMELITNSGVARSSALTAMKEARQGNFDLAEQLMEEAQESVNRAHLVQTKLIEADEGEGKIKVTLILVHAQDHLMNCMLCMDMAKEIISLNKVLAK